jgi:ferritin-like metal-binding protein YciE
MIESASSPELRNALEHHLGEIGNQVEHYEIALYGSLISFARQPGLQQAVEPLERILAEEKAADAKLTQIADSD